MANLDPDNSKGSSINRSVPEVGLQAARCYAIVDLGNHKPMFEGQPARDTKTGNLLPPKRDIMICFELTKYMTTYNEEQGAVPYSIQQRYSFSAGTKAKLPDVLKSWGKMPKRPEKIDLRPFVGKVAILNVEHSEDGKYANIGNKGRGISPWSKEFPITKVHYFYTPPKEKGQPPLKNGIFFELDKFDPIIFEQLPSHTKSVIAQSIEWPSIVAKYPQCAIKPKEEEQAQETPFNEEEIQPIDDGFNPLD